MAGLCGGHLSLRRSSSNLHKPGDGDHGRPGRDVTIHLRASLKIDDTILAYRAVLAGMGIAFLPEWLVESDLATGTLARLLPDHRLPPITLVRRLYEPEVFDIEGPIVYRQFLESPRCAGVNGRSLATRGVASEALVHVPAAPRREIMKSTNALILGSG